MEAVEGGCSLFADSLFLASFRCNSVQFTSTRFPIARLKFGHDVRARACGRQRNRTATEDFYPVARVTVLCL